jgi:hemerythrin
MPLLKWNDGLSVGISDMDWQHKKLVDLINEFHAAMAVGKGDDLKEAVLADLLSYTRFHFAAEEKLMQQHGYPQLPEHQRQHDALTRRVRESTARLRAGHTVTSVGLAGFLRDWLQTHITQQDKQYGQFICQGAGV